MFVRQEFPLLGTRAPTQFFAFHVRRRLSIFALLLAWLCANGAVWNVVQVVAWAKMLNDYSTVMPIGQALKLTFDGSAPCELCQLSQKAQDDARNETSPATALGGSDKLLIAFQAVTPLVLSNPASPWPGLVDERGLLRATAVPVPPPRA